MAHTLRAPVGHLGKNLDDDVRTVRRLLNNVPDSEGGPPRPLPVHGDSDDALVTAIRTFQLRQFGWSMADGLVEPGRQTLARLDELQPAPAPPHPRPRPPAVPERGPAGVEFVAQQPGRPGTRAQAPEDFFFLMTDATNNLARLFWLGMPEGYLTAPAVDFPSGSGLAMTIFSVVPPGMALEDFATEAIYITREVDGVLQSEVVIGSGSRHVRFDVHRHLLASSGGTTTTQRVGTFQLVHAPDVFMKAGG